jgi:hypothetical protein
VIVCIDIEGDLMRRFALKSLLCGALNISKSFTCGPASLSYMFWPFEVVADSLLVFFLL